MKTKEAVLQFYVKLLEFLSSATFDNVDVTTLQQSYNRLQSEITLDPDIPIGEYYMAFRNSPEEVTETIYEAVLRDLENQFRNPNARRIVHAYEKFLDVDKRYTHCTMIVKEEKPIPDEVDAQGVTGWTFVKLMVRNVPEWRNRMAGCSGVRFIGSP